MNADTINMLGHFIIVAVVIISATILAATGHIDTATIATVYGAALGFTTGAVIRRGGQGQ